LIAGSVTEDGIPMIEVSVGGRIWQCTIDTGFNGQLELSEQLRARVNPQRVGRVTSLLAANQRIEEDLYLVDFPFDGRVVRAQATFSDSSTLLIGTGLLTDYRLGIDFPARTVTLDRQ
jgi:predicted aspartyl protease